MKKLFSNISLLTLSELIEKLILFLLFIYMGRTFSQKDFGLLNYIFAITSYFIIFIDLGLPQLATREIAANKKIAISLFQIIIFIKFCLFLVMTIVWIIFIYILNEKYFIIGVLIVFYFFGRVIDIIWYLQGLQNFVLISKLKFLKSIILTISFIPLHFCPMPYCYISFLIIAIIFPFLFYIFNLKLLKYLKYNKFKFYLKNNYRIKIVITKSLPLIASTFLILLYYNLDAILIKYFLGFEDVAVYNAAYKLIFAFIIVRNVFVSLIYPRMSKYKFDWQEDKYFFIVGVAFCILILLISYFFSEDILYISYGDKYINSNSVFLILASTAGVLWLNLFFPMFFIAIKKEIFYLKVHVITAFLNFIGNVFFIPIYGIEGAAFATLIADTLSLVIFGLSYINIKYFRRII